MISWHLFPLPSQAVIVTGKPKTVAPKTCNGKLKTMDAEIENTKTREEGEEISELKESEYPGSNSSDTLFISISFK